MSLCSGMSNQQPTVVERHAAQKRMPISMGFPAIANWDRILSDRGEPLSTELCRRLSRAGEFMVRNHYGQTEAQG